MNNCSNLDGIYKQIEQFQKNSEELKSLQESIHSQSISSTQYPNEESNKLVECITGSLDKRVTIIGYGSLINPGTGLSSTDQISSESYNTMREVIVFGWKRIFNWDVRVGGKFPPTYVSYQNEQASLNTVPEEGAYFNAVAIDITANELNELKKREIGYDMVTVAYASLQGIQDAIQIFNKAVIFSASSEERQSFENPSEKVVYTNSSIVPRRYYLDLVSSICQYRKSEEFFELYNNTTFMADGKQLAAEWRKKASIPTKDDVKNDENKQEGVAKIIDYEATRESLWKDKFG